MIIWMISESLIKEMLYVGRTDRKRRIVMSIPVNSREIQPMKSNKITAGNLVFSELNSAR
jgi:hypothetical protein